MHLVAVYAMLVLGVVLALVLIGMSHSVDAGLTYAQGKKGMMALDGRLATERFAGSESATQRAGVRAPVIRGLGQ